MSGVFSGAEHLHDPVFQLVGKTDSLADVAVRPFCYHGGDDTEELLRKGAHFLHESLTKVVGSLRIVDTVCPAKKAKALKGNLKKGDYISHITWLMTCFHEKLSFIPVT